MPDEPRPADEFQYHSGELDLTGDPAEGNWSIRCMDVHKRLGGVSVLNGLNVAFPTRRSPSCSAPRAPARAC